MIEPAPGSDTADLRSYYEEEARQRRRPVPTGRRAELHAEFVELLRTEGRRSIIDFGAGPGFDGPGFQRAGLHYVGLDLAHGNGVQARTAGIAVVQGSMAAPPFAAMSFDAGWSMSALMHLADPNVPATVSAMASVLRPGAPLVVGQWGGAPQTRVDTEKLPGHRRAFHSRPAERNRELLTAIGTVAELARWPTGGDGEYQAFLVRIGGAPT